MLKLLGILLISLGSVTVPARALTIAEITDVVTKFDEVPSPIKTFPPKYPSELKREGISGVVTMAMVLDEKGEVMAAEIVKTTHEGFSEAAIEAVKRWRFKPGKVGGVAVKAKVTIPLRFNAE